MSLFEWLNIGIKLNHYKAFHHKAEIKLFEKTECQVLCKNKLRDSAFSQDKLGIQNLFSILFFRLLSFITNGIMHVKRSFVRNIDGDIGNLTLKIERRSQNKKKIIANSKTFPNVKIEDWWMDFCSKTKMYPCARRR